MEVIIILILVIFAASQAIKVIQKVGIEPIVGAIILFAFSIIANNWDYIVSLFSKLAISSLVIYFLMIARFEAKRGYERFIQNRESRKLRIVNKRGLKIDIEVYPNNGHEFEHWVADLLREYGWSTEVTSASGDHGLDVLAKRDHLTLGIQCKRSKNPVGNKAVQEAYAGCKFYGCDKVAVLTNSSFTPSARALGEVCQVYLVTNLDIPNLHEIVGLPRKQSRRLRILGR